MKKVIKLAFFLISCVSITIMLLTLSTNSLLKLDFNNLKLKTFAIDQPNLCKWKRLDCSGWFTGTYEACLTSGDGNSCTCGNITRDCVKD